MRITVQAKPGELASRLGDAVRTLEQIAARGGALHKSERTELLVPEMKAAVDKARPDVERIRALLEKRLLELLG